jgi:hypothetical protein
MAIHGPFIEEANINRVVLYTLNPAVDILESL